MKGWVLLLYTLQLYIQRKWVHVFRLTTAVLHTCTCMHVGCYDEPLVTELPVSVLAEHGIIDNPSVSLLVCNVS